jgi:hypothetical protein
MKNERYYIFGTISNPFGKSQKDGKSTPLILLFGTGTSMKKPSGMVKLCLWTQISALSEMMHSASH